MLPACHFVLQFGIEKKRVAATKFFSDNFEQIQKRRRIGCCASSSDFFYHNLKKNT